MKQFKRMLALFLAVCMVGSAMNLPVFAEALNEPTEQTEQVPEETPEEIPEEEPEEVPEEEPEEEPEEIPEEEPEEVPEEGLEAQSEEPELEPISYVVRSWDGSRVTEHTETTTDYILVDAAVTEFIPGTTYVAVGNVTVNNRVSIKDNRGAAVRLILTDGCYLTLKAGVTVDENDTLRIYGQTQDSGVLKAVGTSNGAAIGFSWTGSSGTVEVYGGTVKATSAYKSAIIGAGASLDKGRVGYLKIYGGSVEATNTGGKAIGYAGGYNTSPGGLTVYGGQLTAKGSDGAMRPGIGIELGKNVGLCYGDSEDSLTATMTSVNIGWMNASKYAETHIHEPGEEHAAVAATCVAEGNVAYWDCTVCGEAVNAAGEAILTVQAIDPENHAWSETWEYDGENHWRVCTYNSEHIDRTAHTGGEATCVELAVCDVCQQPYGQVDESKHVMEQAADGENHWMTCRYHKDVREDEEAHIGGEASCVEQAVCDVCGESYGDLAAHTGGEATCVEKAVCDVCQQPYGEVDESKHVMEQAADGENHWMTCQYHKEVQENVEAHYGGEATCVEQAMCDVCAQPYGEVDENNHDWDTAWSSDVFGHWHECWNGCLNKKDEAEHSGGTLTCMDQAVCEVCGEAYGDTEDDSAHKWEDAHDETHHWQVCARNPEHIKDKNAHYGGEATCTDKALCDLCGTAYGEVNPNAHDWQMTFDENEHWQVCSRDASHQKGRAAHVGSPATCQTRFTCDICHQSFGQLGDHDFGDWVTDGLYRWKECRTEGCTEIAEREGHVPYVSRSWENGTVAETAETAADFVVVDGNTTAFEDGGLYVVSGQVTNGNRIEVTGSADLILLDGSALTLTEGIHVGQGNALSLFGQTEDTGLLTVEMRSSNAAIGGNNRETAGSITVHGGTVNAVSQYDSAAIGGGDFGGSGGSFTVYGGKVTAANMNNGAAIGGGWSGSGGSVAVYGGEVIASSAGDGAAIGGGRNGGPATVIMGKGVALVLGANEAEAVPAAIDDQLGSALNGAKYVRIHWHTLDETGVCTICGQQIGGHVPGEVHVAAVPATCMQEGNVEYWLCADCNAPVDADGYLLLDVKTDINPDAHQWTVEETDDYQHYLVCACGNELWEDHRGGTADCRNQALCEVCQTPYGERDDHVYGEIQEDGRRRCTVCGKPSERILESMTYLARWEEAGRVHSETRTAENVLLVEDATEQLLSGFYAVVGNVTVDRRIRAKGDVSLILTDGASLTVNGGIDMTEGNSLTIYGQTQDSGQLTVISDSGDVAAIGGNENHYGGTLTISGGTITASVHGNYPAIDVDTAIVSGGTVTAVQSGSYNAISAQTLTVSGGTVTVEGTVMGIDAEIMTVSGGTVNASGGQAGVFARELAISSGEVNVNADGLAGVYAVELAISGGSLVVSGESAYASIVCGSFDLSGGFVYADNTGMGSALMVTEGFLLENCMGFAYVDADGEERTLFTAEEAMEALGSAVTLQSTQHDPDEVGICHICGQQAHVHDWEETYQANDVNHWQVCKTDPNHRSAMQKHSGGTADCQTRANCEVCGHPYGSFGAHQFGGEKIYDGDDYWYACQVPGCDAVSGRHLASVPYVLRTAADPQGVARTAGAIQVTEDTVQMESGFYVVTEDVTVESRLEALGNVRLILADGATLTAPEGITVNQGNSLTIFGQTQDSGRLIATAPEVLFMGEKMAASAAIGAFLSEGEVSALVTALMTGSMPAAKASGQIVLSGGTVEADSNGFGAAIGGSFFGDGYVTVYGGVVNAGAEAEADFAGAAAIGGGAMGKGHVTVCGGQVNACNRSEAPMMGLSAAAIGDGATVSMEIEMPEEGLKAGGSVAIYGGDVTAAASNGYAIGGGVLGMSDWGDAMEYANTWSTVAVSGGSVTASVLGEGFGSGILGHLTVSGGSVNADDAGIVGDISVSGGTVTARNSGMFGDVAITGGSVTASGEIEYMNPAIQQGAIVLGTNVGAAYGPGAEELTWVSGTGEDMRETLGDACYIQTHTHEIGEWVFGGIYRWKECRIGDCPYQTEGEYGVFYVSRSWENGAVAETAETAVDFVVVDGNTTAFEDGGLYVVSGQVTNGNRIEVTGSAGLILLDGSALTLTQGIHVGQGNALSLFGQTENTGLLTVEMRSSNAAIGGNNREAAGSITVHGGTVNAVSQWDSAAIGGGDLGGSGGSFTIFGGKVTAANKNDGAAIGGGWEGSGGSVAIYGGEVIASTTGGGAAIGGGLYCAPAAVTLGAGTLLTFGPNEAEAKTYVPDEQLGRNLHNAKFARTAHRHTLDASGYCTDCHAQVKNHPMGLHHPANAATCAVEGNIEYWVCPDCGANVNAAGTLLDAVLIHTNPEAHEWTVEGTDEYQHYLVCPYGHGEWEDHFGGTADCRNQALCEVCQTPYGELESHIYGEIQEDGRRRCTVCGKASELTQDSLTYLARWEENGRVRSETRTAENVLLVEEATEQLLSGFYAVVGDVTVDRRIRAKGDVSLILTDGASLTVNGGIGVTEGNSLTIYGQTQDSGQLTVLSDSGDVAAIGGNENHYGGTLTISGGNVTVTGNGDDETIDVYVFTVSGGTVVATAHGDDEAIDADVFTVSGGSVTVTEYGDYEAICADTFTVSGGAVTVESYLDDAIYSNAFTVTGGTVIATAHSDDEAIDADVFTVSGGTVIAESYHYNGIYSESMTVSGGSVVATAYGDYNAIEADTFTVSGGTVTARSDDNASICTGQFTISGGSVFAQNMGEGNALYIYDGLTLENCMGFVCTTQDGTERKLFAEGEWGEILDGAKMVLTVQHDPDENGLCTLCGQTVHVHTWADALSYDGLAHWQVCTENPEHRQNVGFHSGGTANCQNQAECEVCGAPYGPYGDHVFTEEWMEDETTRWHMCTVPGCTAISEKYLKNVSYVRRSVADGTVTAEQTAAQDVILVDQNTKSFADGAVYAVSGAVTNANRIAVSGNAGLILLDGSSLTLVKGIQVSEGNGLSIYGQSQGTGTLTVRMESTDSSIGGNNGENCGTVTIHGGCVNAANAYDGAAIGGGNGDGNGGEITILGGTVTAANTGNGAAIGGGWYGSGGNIAIYGGMVTATATGDGAAIGGGWCGSGGNIAIYGGTVTATATGGGAAIGGGWNSDGGTVTINGGRVTAIATGNGAAIGGDDGRSSNVTLGSGVFVSYGESADSITGTLTNGDENIGQILNTAKFAQTKYLPTLMGSTLTLGGEIGLNFYFDLPDSLQNVTAVLSCPGQSAKDVQMRLTKAGNGYYKASYTVVAKEMQEQVTVTLLDGDGEPLDMVLVTDVRTPVSSYSYSVAAYLNQAKQHGGDLAQLAKAMEAYGQYSQLYLNYKTDTVGNPMDVSSVTAADLEAFRMVCPENPDGVTFLGTTLVLNAMTSLRFYFNLDSVQNHTFLVNGKTVSPTLRDGMYYVALTDIPAKELGQTVTVTVDGVEYQASPLSYAQNVLQSYDGNPDKTALCSLVRAQYLYYQAAAAYFGNAERK